MAEPTLITKTIDVQQSQPGWKDLLPWILEGTEIVFSEGSRPLARLLPFTSPSSPRRPRLHKGAIQVSADFDEPLPDDFWVNVP
jgi:antitoxin (DNA-binding transcriptional repressor) of toxin-antitoxin stability system